MSGSNCWTGGFEVLFTERAEGYGEKGKFGACVNVVAHADSAMLFREMATRALYNEGFIVLEVEDICQIDLQESGFPDDEINRILECFDAGHPVGFGAFYCYPKDRLDG